MTSYIGAVCGNRISRSFWYERGLFPSIQALPSTVNVRTQASKLPIEQPPHPLDRSSLDLKNPERSSSLEPPRTLTRHWSSRRGCPRATTRRCHLRTPEHGLLGSETTKRNHHWSPLRPSFHLAVEASPSESQRASTRRSHLWTPRPTRQSPPCLLKPRWDALRASIQESRTTIRVISGRSVVWRWNVGHQILHAPPRAVEAPAKFSPRQHARARSNVCKAHTTTLLAHAQAMCRFAVPLRQPLSPR